MSGSFRRLVWRRGRVVHHFYGNVSETVPRVSEVMEKIGFLSPSKYWLLVTGSTAEQSWLHF